MSIAGRRVIAGKVVDFSCRTKHRPATAAQRVPIGSCAYMYVSLASIGEYWSVSVRLLLSWHLLLSQSFRVLLALESKLISRLCLGDSILAG